MSPDAEDMVLLTPDEINRFILTLKSRYTGGALGSNIANAAAKKRSGKSVIHSSR